MFALFDESKHFFFLLYTLLSTFFKHTWRKIFTLLNNDLKSKVNVFKKLNVGMKILYLTLDLLE